MNYYTYISDFFYENNNFTDFYDYANDVE